MMDFTQKDQSAISDKKPWLLQQLNTQFHEILIQTLITEMYFRLQSRIDSRHRFSRFQAVLSNFDNSIAQAKNVEERVHCLQSFSEQMANLDAATYSTFKLSIDKIITNEQLPGMKSDENDVQYEAKIGDEEQDVTERASIVSAISVASVVSNASAVMVMKNILPDPTLSLIYKRLHSILKEKQDELERLIDRKKTAESKLDNFFKENILDDEKMSDADKEKYEMLYLQANYPALLEAHDLDWSDNANAVVNVLNQTWQTNVENAIKDLHQYSRRENLTGLLSKIKLKVGGWRIFGRTPSHYYTVMKLLEIVKKETLTPKEVNDALRRAERICRANSFNLTNVTDVLGDMRLAFKSAWDSSFDFDSAYPDPKAMIEFENQVKQREKSAKKYQALIKHTATIGARTIVVDSASLPKTVPEIQAFVYFMFKKNMPDISFLTWTVEEGLNIALEEYSDLMQTIADLRDESELYFIVLMFCILMVALKPSSRTAHYNFFESQLVKALSNDYRLMQEKDLENTLTAAGLIWLQSYMPQNISTNAAALEKQKRIKERLLELFNPEVIAVEFSKYYSDEEEQDSCGEEENITNRNSFFGRMSSIGSAAATAMFSPGKRAVADALNWRESKEAFEAQAKKYAQMIIGDSPNFNEHAEYNVVTIMEDYFSRYFATTNAETLMLLILMKWFFSNINEIRNQSFVGKCQDFCETITTKLDEHASDKIVAFAWKEWEQVALTPQKSIISASGNKSWDSARRLLAIAKEFYVDGNVLLYAKISPAASSSDSSSSDQPASLAAVGLTTMPGIFPENIPDGASALSPSHQGSSRSLISTDDISSSQSLPQPSIKAAPVSLRFRPPAWYDSIAQEMKQKMSKVFSIGSMDEAAFINTMARQGLSAFSDPGDNQHLRSVMVLYCVFEWYCTKKLRNFSQVCKMQAQLKSYIDDHLLHVDLGQCRPQASYTDDFAKLFQVIDSLFSHGLVYDSSHCVSYLSNGKP